MFSTSALSSMGFGRQKILVQILKEQVILMLKILIRYKAQPSIEEKKIFLLDKDRKVGRVIKVGQ